MNDPILFLLFKRIADKIRIHYPQITIDSDNIMSLKNIDYSSKYVSNEKDQRIFCLDDRSFCFRIFVYSESLNSNAIKSFFLQNTNCIYSKPLICMNNEINLINLLDMCSNKMGIELRSRLDGQIMSLQFKMLYNKEKKLLDVIIIVFEK